MRFKPFILTLIIVLLAGCGNASGTADDFSFPADITEKTLIIPGLKDEYRLLLISDLHIIAPEDPEVNDEKKEEVAARRDTLFIHDDLKSAEFWEMTAPSIDSLGADLVLLGGDMIDYCSGANMEILKKGLDLIKTPLIYVRADHDTETWYTDTHMTAEDSKELHDALETSGASNDEIILHDLGELNVIGINDSTSWFTASRLNAWNSALDEGKPTVVITHVPVKPLEDTALAELSKEAWQDRALIWGDDCYHVPDAVTAEAYSRLYSEDSPVYAVLSGHLHFAYEGLLTEKTTQIVNAPAYEGHVTLITVRGE